MNIERIEKNSVICAVVRSEEIVITNSQSALDLLMTAKVASRKWTHWCQLPFIDYGDGAISGKPADTTETEYTLGSRSLQKGSKGTDVKTLQELLLRLDYDLPK